MSKTVLKEFIQKCNQLQTYYNSHKKKSKANSDELCIRFRKLIHFTHENNIFDDFHSIFKDDSNITKKLNDLKSKANTMLNKKKK